MALCHPLSFFRQYRKKHQIKRGLWTLQFLLAGIKRTLISCKHGPAFMREEGRISSQRGKPGVMEIYTLCLAGGQDYCGPLALF